MGVRHYVNYRTLLAAAVVLAALTAMYFLGRNQFALLAADRPIVEGESQARSRELARTRTALRSDADRHAAKTHAASLPRSDIPLKDEYAELWKRAQEGDAAAAKRLLGGLNVCKSLRNIERIASNYSDEVLGKETNSMDAAQLKTYEIQLDSVAANQQNLQHMHALCDGVSGGMFDTLVPSLQQAAALGDADARACYLSRGPNFDMPSFLNHPEYLDTYRLRAQSMIEDGMANGDWRVVDLLRDAYQPGAQSLLAGVMGTDPVQYYRNLKLLRLGAGVNRPVELDQQVSDAAAHLTAEQRADADAWAQATFAQNFRGSSTELAPPGWDACYFTYDQ